MKTFNDVAGLMHEVFSDCQALRVAGQKEYAGGDDALGNFNRLAKELGISPAAVLWTYAMKHKDGIAAFIRGHKSQREDVRGRIKDLIVYLILLHAIFDEEQGLGQTSNRTTVATPFGIADPIKSLVDESFQMPDVIPAEEN